MRKEYDFSLAKPNPRILIKQIINIFNLCYLISQTICLILVLQNMYKIFNYYDFPKIIQNIVFILFGIPFLMFYIMGLTFIIFVHPIIVSIFCIIKIKNHAIKIKHIVILAWSIINSIIYLYLLFGQGFLITV